VIAGCATAAASKDAAAKSAYGFLIAKRLNPLRSQSCACEQGAKATAANDEKPFDTLLRVANLAPAAARG